MKVGISNKISLIQTAYFIEALIELFDNKHIFCFDYTEKDKLRYLEQIFGYHTKVGFLGIDLLLDLDVDHAKPSITLMGNEYSLVFPRRLISKIREKWPKRRKYRYSFVGLITDRRKWLLEYKNKANAFVVNSNRGRVFPVKLFDENYWKILLNTEFTLCPQGDHLWTYRVFESIIADSIPVVDVRYPLISQFEVYKKGSEQNVQWSETLAQQNLNRLIENFTLNDLDRNKFDMAFNMNAARSRKKKILLSIQASIKSFQNLIPVSIIKIYLRTLKKYLRNKFSG